MANKRARCVVNFFTPIWLNFLLMLAVCLSALVANAYRSLAAHTVKSVPIQRCRKLASAAMGPVCTSFLLSAPLHARTQCHIRCACQCAKAKHRQLCGVWRVVMWGGAYCGGCGLEAIPVVHLGVGLFQPRKPRLHEQIVRRRGSSSAGKPRRYHRRACQRVRRIFDGGSTFRLLLCHGGGTLRLLLCRRSSLLL